MANRRAQPFSLAEMIARIEGDAGLRYVRFGDGEFFCLQGQSGENCDGAPYSPAQAAALRAVLADGSIVHGLTSIASTRAYANEWCASEGIAVDWVDGDVLQDASDGGALAPFVECMRRRAIVLVGPEHLARLGAFPHAKALITIHPTRAFENVDHIEATVRGAVRALDADTVLVSGGPGAGKVLISRLDISGLSVIDVGSLWDMYVGVLSRSGPKRLGRAGIEALGRLNFGTEVGAWWPN